MLGESLVTVLSQPLWVFLTVLARLSPVIALAPPVNTTALPMRLRALLAIAIASLLTPLASASATAMPSDIMHLTIGLAGELLLGILLGSIILLAIVCLQIAGQTIGHLAGMDIAVSVDPSSNEEMPVLSNLLGMLAVAILLTMGGHRQLLGCALESFASYPAGGVYFESPWLVELEQVLRHTFVVGLRAAAPLAIALLLSNIVTGLLARTLPQLNILSIGFNLNVSVLLLVLSLSLGSLTWVYQHELAMWIAGCQRVVSVEPAAGW